MVNLCGMMSKAVCLIACLLAYLPVFAQSGQSSTASVEGLVIDQETGRPIGYATISVQTEQGQTVARQQTTSNGVFRIRLSPQQRYIIEVVADGYQTGHDVLDFTVPYVRQVTGKRFRLTAGNASPAPVVNTSLITVYFAPRNAMLSPLSLQALTQLTTRLQTSTARVVLTGFTDGQGNAGLNEVLAGDRAAAVRTFLIDNGIRSERIIVRKTGVNVPLPDTAPARQRRVEIRIE